MNFICLRENAQSKRIKKFVDDSKLKNLMLLTNEVGSFSTYFIIILIMYFCIITLFLQKMITTQLKSNND